MWGSGGKRQVGELHSAVAEQKARQVAWLQRNRKGAKTSMWRPRKRFRMSAKRWAAHLDNQAPHLDLGWAPGLVREGHGVDFDRFVMALALRPPPPP